MKYRVVIQPSAAVGMHDGYLWIAERAPESATKWFNGLQAAIYSLEDFPQRCPLAEESKAFSVENSAVGLRKGRGRLPDIIHRYRK